MELAETLNCKLSGSELEMCIKLIESAKADSTALALLVSELQRAIPVNNTDKK